MTESRVKSAIIDTLQDARSTAGKFLSSASEAGTQFDPISKLRFTSAVSQSSKLGVTLGETVNGFTALGVSADNVIPGLDISVPLQTNNSLVPVQLTKDVTQVKNDLVKQVPSADATDLATITGSSNLSSNGFLNVSISAPFPNAIAETVKDAVPNVTKTNLKAISKNVVDLNDGIFGTIKNVSEDVDALFDNAIGDVVGDVFGDLGKNTFNKLSLSTVAGIVNSNNVLTSAISFGFESLIENAVEKTLETGSIAISSVATKGGIPVEIPSSDRAAILQLVSAGKPAAAAAILSKYSDQPINTITDKLKTIDNRGSTAINRPTEGVTVKSKNIANIANGWKGDDTTESYFRQNIVDNANELKIELANINREVTEIVITSSNTLNTSDLTAYDFHETLVLNKQAGDYGFEELEDQRLAHYTIRINGIIERGLPVDLEIESTPILPNNHHQRSILVEMVGGNLSNDRDNYSAAAYSQAQWDALDKILRSAYEAYPGMQVVGMSNIGSQYQAPHFDVIEHVNNKYNKKSAFSDPRTQGPFTRVNLVKLNQGGL